MCHEQVDDVLLHTYIDTYIGTEVFAICYSCIWGSLRLAPNYMDAWEGHAENRSTGIFLLTRYRQGNIPSVVTF